MYMCFGLNHPRFQVERSQLFAHPSCCGYLLYRDNLKWGALDFARVSSVPCEAPQSSLPPPADAPVHGQQREEGFVSLSLLPAFTSQ